MKAQAIVFTDVGQVTVSPVAIPAPGNGELLLEALYTCISPGTELRCRAGKQAGASFPFIAGYAFVGRVIACGAETTLKTGTLVCCSGTRDATLNRMWGGHISHAVQLERDVYPLPAGVAPVWGSAAHMAAIAYRGVRLSRPQPGESVAVIGLGLIGALAARLYAASGARVVAADLAPQRVVVTQDAGIEALVVQGSLADTFAQALPDGADVVVDATGVPHVLADALTLAKAKAWDDSAELGARIVIQGSYSADVCLPYDSAFAKELSFYVPRDAQPRDVRAVLALMVHGALNLDGIISDIRSPETAPETYAELAQADTELMTVAFKWHD
jgi:2-desacetyl-2-hydroxyethyl bacteriochlorophyllide A dehydrogenase